MQKNIFLLVCKALRTIERDDVGAARDTVLQEIRLGAGSKTGDFAEEKLGGGATVEPLHHHPKHDLRRHFVRSKPDREHFYYAL